MKITIKTCWFSDVSKEENINYINESTQIDESYKRIELKRDRKIYLQMYNVVNKQIEIELS